VPTYIQKTTNSDLSPFAEFNKVLSSGTGTDTGITIALTAAQVTTGGFITPSGTPNSELWESGGTWTVEVEIDVGNNKILARARCVRLDSAGTVLQTGTYTAQDSLVATTSFSPVAPSWTRTEEDVDNRLAVEIEFTCDSNMDQSATIGVGTTANEIITNITEDQSWTATSGTTTLFTNGLVAGIPISTSGDLYVEGYQTTSGNLDIIIDGYETASGSIDLSTIGYGLESGNINLYIENITVPSGTVNLSIAGHFSLSGTTDLYTLGKQIISGSIDLFTEGNQNTSGTLNLTALGHNILSGSIDLVSAGYDSTSGSFDLSITGKPSGTIPLFISSLNISDNNLDLHTLGKDVSSGNLSLFVGSSNTINQNMDLIITGKPSGSIDLFESGYGVASGNSDLYINGITSNSGTLDLTIVGNETVSGTLDVSIAGHTSSSGSIDLAISGIATTTNDITLFISSINLLSRSMSLHITGKPSGTIDLVSFGYQPLSGSTDLFVDGLSNIQNSSGVLDLTIMSHEYSSNTIDLVINSYESVSGSTDMFVEGADVSSGIVNLTEHGMDTSSGTIDLILTGGAAQSTNNLPLFVDGSGIIVVSGQTSGILDLFVNGIEPLPALACPALDASASLQITNEVVNIYQTRIDALINQLGKSVLLEFDPVRQPCSNCIFDPIRNRSTGIYKTGGPRPFTRSRQCPWCKGKGFEETQATRCIEALIKWNPRDSEKYGISLENYKSVVRIKTFSTEADDIVRARTAIVDYQEIGTTIARVRLIRNPIPVGLRQSRYCISFWELI